ncbi:MAG: HepT-like ribonuclease domain-containing protein [Desulfuromonadales bacterium]
MSSRDPRLYIDDIRDAISAIEEYTRGLDLEGFSSDRKTYSATLREFIVIGEAINHVPEEARLKVPTIEWRLIKDFRNFIIHEYFGIDARIVWDAVRLELPALKAGISKLIELFD